MATISSRKQDHSLELDDLALEDKKRTGVRNMAFNFQESVFAVNTSGCFDVISK